MIIQNDKAALRTLREYLWRGSAAAFIGCGFSRNAVRKDLQYPLPPLWKGFGEKFVRLLKGYDDVECSPDVEKEIDKYLEGKNPLVLTQEYESLMGRTAMVDVVRKMINDSNLMPHNLHKDLLRLPWSDVFTTNYDTLLERAAEDLRDLNYHTITLCEQIVGSTHPRIVKLHGTWAGNEEDWVITEEDYRKYANRFSPFVNMVRQSAMESCLCLIGFSGTDPNFLAWIGWVRDNLKAAGLPIFLLTADNYSTGELRTLAEKRIVPINIFEVANDISGQGISDGDYQHAYAVIFKYLDPENQESVRLPTQEAARFITAKTDDVERLKDWCAAIDKYKHCYPGWVVAPYNLRNSICAWPSIFDRAVALTDLLPRAERISTLYLLDWYHSLSLRPLSDKMFKTYLALWREFRTGDYGIAGSALRTKFNSILFSLWRNCRETGEDGLWRDLNSYFEQDGALDMNQLYYERILRSLSVFAVPEVKSYIEKWHSTEKSDEWNIKYASVLLRIGRNDAARTMISNALVSIRNKVPKGLRVSNRYYLSLEGIALFLLQSIDDLSESPEAEHLVEWNSRLERLSEYQCNPREDLEKFDLVFSGEFSPLKLVTRRRNFDCTVKARHLFARLPFHCDVAASYFRFLEVTGFGACSSGFLMAERHLGTARKWFLYGYPSNAPTLNWDAAMTDPKEREWVYSEKVLSRMSRDDAESRVIEYVRQINYLLLPSENPLEFDRSVKLLSFLLETVSKLVCKVCDSEILESVLDAGLKVYGAPRYGYESTIQASAHRFFALVEHALPRKSLVEFLAKIMNAVMPPGGVVFEYERLSPILALPSMRRRTDGVIPEQTLKAIDSLFEKLKDASVVGFKDAILKLAYCERLGVLDNKRRALLAFHLAKLMESNESYVDDLSITYLNMLLRPQSDKEADGKIESLLLHRMCANVKEPCEFGQSNNAFFKDIFHAYGLSFEGQESYANIWDDRRVWLQEYLLRRIEGQGNCNSDDDLVAQEWFVVDFLLGDVILPRQSEDEKRVFFERWEKMASTAINDRFFPLTVLTIYNSVSDVSDFIKSFPLFDDVRLVNHFVEVLGVYASRIKPADEKSRIVSDFLTALFALRTDEVFISVCYCLAKIIDRFGRDFLGLYDILNAMASLELETRFECGRRFPQDELMDYRSAVAYLCAVIWRKCNGMDDKKGLFAVLAIWKKKCESSDEMLRVRLSWQSGLENTDEDVSSV